MSPWGGAGARHLGHLLLSQGISRELDRKRSSWDTNWCPYGVLVMWEKAGRWIKFLSWRPHLPHPHVILSSSDDPSPRCTSPDLGQDQVTTPLFEAQ